MVGLPSRAELPRVAPAKPLAALALTRSGKCLVSCAVGAHDRVRLLPLSRLLTAMQQMGGHPHASYVQMESYAVCLRAGGSVVMGVVCETGDDAHAAARLAAMQALHVFLKLHGDEASALDQAHVAEAEAEAEAYTVHSAVKEGSPEPEGESSATLPAFLPFARHYLQPLLLAPPPTDSWLSPLLQPAAVLRALLVDPAPAAGEEAVLLASSPSTERPLSFATGPNVPAAWSAVLAHAHAAVEARAAERAPASDKQNRRSRLALLAFPELTDGSGRCLHAALRAVRLAPSSACLVVYYSAPAPTAPAIAAAAATAATAAATASLHDAATGEGAPVLVLEQSAVPQEVRVSLNACSRLIGAAFPTVVNSVPEIKADAARAMAGTHLFEDEDESSPQHGTPRRHVAGSPIGEGGGTAGEDQTMQAAAEPGTPLQLSVESPRAFEPEQPESEATHPPSDDQLPAGGVRQRVGPPRPLQARRELYAAGEEGADEQQGG